jgi:hypothetical protein
MSDLRPALDGVKRRIEWFYNWIRGYGFYWARDEHGWYLEIRKGTCPYPVQFDWSAKSCIKAGECGCDEKEKMATAYGADKRPA